MSTNNLFFLKSLLLLWVVCVVLCDHSRRDVRRIIIKDRPSRSPKKRHHSHSHSHRGSGRSHSHSHSSRDHNHAHKSKGKKQKHSSEEDGSFEDSDASFSRENSYEDKFHSYKAHKSQHRSPKTSHRKPSHSFDYETSRPEPYRDESGLRHHGDWLPFSSELVNRFASLEEYGNNGKKRKDRKHRKDYIQAMKPPPIELTTSYPFHFDTTSDFPQVGFANSFPNWNYNQKLFQPNVPLIGTIEQPNVQPEDDSGRLKNHRTSFEDAGQSSNTLINVPDDSGSVGSNEEKSRAAYRTRTTDKTTMTTTTTTIRPSRSRGRGNYRGTKKQ